MPDQDQQLQLVVTLVDQATPGLRQLRNELQQTGNMSAERLKSAAGDIEKHAAKVGEHTKELTREVNNSIRELGRFASSVTGLPLGEFGKLVNGMTGGIGGFAEAIAALPLVIRELGETLNQFSERMTGLKDSAESIGLTATAFRGLTDQMEQAGIKGERANQAVTNFVKTIGAAVRPGSAQMAAFNVTAEPGRWIAEARRLETMIEQGRTGAAITRGVGDVTREEERLRARGMSSQDAAYWTNELAKALGLPSDWRRLRERNLRDVTPGSPEERRIEEQIKKAEEQEKAAADLSKAFRDANDELVSNLIPAFIKFEEALTGFINANPFNALVIEVGLVVSGLATLRIALAALGLGGGAAAAGAGAAAGVEGAAGGAAVSRLLSPSLLAAAIPIIVTAVAAYLIKTKIGDEAVQKALEDYDKAHPGRKLTDMPGLTDEQKKNLQALPPNWRLGFDPAKKSLEDQLGLSDLGGPATGPATKPTHFFGGDPYSSPNIEDRRGDSGPGGGTPGTPSAAPAGSGGGDLDRGAYDKMFGGTPLAGQYDNVVKAAQANNVPPSVMAAIMAQETGRGTSKMLRDRNNPAGLMDPRTGMQTGKTFLSIDEGVRAAGQAIGRNYQRGGGTIGGMANIYAPVGAANDPGGLNRGWASGVTNFQRQLAGSGGDASNQASRAPGPAGDPTVPQDILATAKQVALRGGPGAVEQFMRQQGYPKAGNWCGEFAASVVKASGYTPPKDAAIASNWRNFGVADPVPHVGDIAIANRGVATGATGSHVTIVEGIDPKTGRFTGLGGNQRAGFESSFSTSGYTFRRPVAREALNRGALNSQTHKVEGSASIDVNVAAPPGTNVKAKSEGIFKPVSMTRQTQMAFAQGGPRMPAGAEFGNGV